MRKTVVLVALVVIALGLAARGPGAEASTPKAATVSSCSYKSVQPYLFKNGVLTVATDSPAYDPWFVNNTPSNGKGYESAVAYAIAKQLGFSKAQVKWTVEPFDASFAPGPKSFDFDVNEISYTAQRATVVTFSASYYDVQQALVALKKSPIVKHHTPAELRTYVYGDQIGSTSLAFIYNELRPTHQPSVFNTLNDAKSALQVNRIEALVADTPTAQYISSSEIPNSVVVGQFPSTGEHYGLLFAKGDKLVACVNKALGSLKANGTLSKLQREWLGIYTSIPTIKP
ncbi:MAG: ABC transporter substrate-binding protein [Acidimicrobiales bacterium]|jgi:polar amino acid transport system substrate-binding protein